MTNTSPLSPLETLLDREAGLDLPLPEEIRGLYGRLQFPPDGNRTFLIGNFVETLDGVISLNEPGFMSPGEISGEDPHDQMVMGLLRAASDVVIAGASAVRSPPGHIWTPDYIYHPWRRPIASCAPTLESPSTR